MVTKIFRFTVFIEMCAAAACIIHHLGNVLHGHDDLGTMAGHEIHSSAHPLHHLSLQ